MSCAIIHIVFTDNIILSDDAIDLLLAAMSDYLALSYPTLYVHSMARSEKGLHTHEARLDVRTSDALTIVSGIANARPAIGMQSCFYMCVDSRRYKTSDYADMPLRLTIETRWCDQRLGRIPPYCMIYLQESLCLTVRMQQAMAMKLIGTIERFGKILCGTVGPDDAVACRYGRGYTDTGESDMSVDRALDLAFWYEDLSQKYLRLRKPAWAMVLGEDMWRQIPANAVREAIEADTRKPDWKAWLDFTSQGTAVIGTGRDAMAYGADMFGFECDEARRICRVLRSAGVML